MKAEQPYNPLDKKNLGASVADALLVRGVIALNSAEAFTGAGIYAIYYIGDFTPYRLLSQANSANRFAMPIYVGKAVPAGSRKGGYGLDVSHGTVLYRRLMEHVQSIEQAENLNLIDFFCRYLVVDDIWISLGESLLIEMFSPLWNVLIEGFGNHDPGRGRQNQQRSAWDVIHPGRPWATKLQRGKKSIDEINELIEKFLAKDYYER